MRPVRLAVDPGVEQEFQDLLQQLEDDEIIARDQAIPAMVRLGAQAVPLLQRQSGHPNLEIRDRCRDAFRRIYASEGEVRALFRGDGNLGATSLALLAFLGSGYSSFSRDELVEPTGFPKYAVGEVVKKGLRWLLSRQTEEGFFSTTDPLGHVMAALTISEVHGLTGQHLFKDPAQRAIASLRAVSSSDPRFLFWKGLLLHSAERHELKDIARLLSQEESTLGRFGSLLLLQLAKDPTGRLRERISDVDCVVRTPADFWIATTAAFKIWGRNSQEWRSWRDAMPMRSLQQWAGENECESGSWAFPGATPEERLETAGYRVLLLHRFYEYSYSLLSP